MNMKICTHHVLGALAAACLAACGGGGNDTATASASPEAAQSPVRAVTVAAATAGSTIVVRARATLAAGVGATMVVRAEGMILGSVSVNNVGTSQDYSFAAPVALGSGARVDVVFVNDGVTVVNGVRTEDRNLIVDSITVDGHAPIAANASGVVVDKGDGNAAFDGLDTVPGQSGLWWNGALRFVLPAAAPSGPVLTVRASASLAAGLGAQMVVRVNGQSVGTATVSNVGAMQAYTFALASAPAPGAKVDVAFVNDGVTVVNGVRTEDRNLYVESIALDAGTPIKSSDAGVTLDRGAGDAAYDGVDVIPGQVALAWNGALRFVLPGAPVLSGNKISVHARAIYPMGVGAQMMVRHNGVLLTAQALAVNTSGISPEPIDFGVAQDYVVNSTAPVRDGDTIDVIATNAGASSTCTGLTCGVRQLVVEGVSVNDQEPMPSSASDVVYDRGEGVAAFDGLNVGPGQQAMPENGALRFKVHAVSASLPMATRLQAARLAFQGVATAAAGLPTSCASGSATVSETITQDISTPIDATQRLRTQTGTRNIDYASCADLGNFMVRTGSARMQFQSSLLIPSTFAEDITSTATLSQFRLSRQNKALVPLQPSANGVIVNGTASATRVRDTASSPTYTAYRSSWSLQAGSTLTDPATSAQAIVVAGRIDGVSGGFGVTSSSTPVDWTFDLAGRRCVVSGLMEQYWGGRFGQVMSYRGSYEVRSNGALIATVKVIDTLRNAEAPASHAYIDLDGFSYPL